MPKLTIEDAEKLALRSRPWSIRMEITGNEVWAATGRGMHEPAEIIWGTQGGKEYRQLATWTAVVDAVTKNLNDGFVYVDAPYRRMSQECLDKIAGASASPANILGGGPSTFVVPPSLDALGAPWNLIRMLKMKRDGVIVLGYSARDENGNEVLMFDPQGGRDFAAEHNLDVEF